jgi:hypothetical protein
LDSYTFIILSRVHGINITFFKFRLPKAWRAMFSNMGRSLVLLVALTDLSFFVQASLIHPLQDQRPGYQVTTPQPDRSHLASSGGGDPSNDGASGATNFHFEVISAPAGYEEWTSPVVCALFS